MGLPIDPVILTLIFLGTFALYTCDRLSDYDNESDWTNAPGRTKWVVSHVKWLQVIIGESRSWICFQLSTARSSISMLNSSLAHVISNINRLDLKRGPYTCLRNWQCNHMPSWHSRIRSECPITDEASYCSTTNVNVEPSPSSSESSGMT